jgi:hypothetical protein
VDVDRNDLADALEDRVVREHAARARACAHGDDPLGLEHLVVDLSQRLRHLVRHPARHDQQVGLARRGAKDLGAEAGDVVASRDDCDHLHCAAGETERVRPDRVALGPGDRLLDGREHELVFQIAQLAFEDARLLPAHEQPLGVQPVVGEAFLALYLRHSSAPFFQT